jgi:hypothetical protein
MAATRPITAATAYKLGVAASVERFGTDCNPYQDWYSLSSAWLQGWHDWKSGYCDERGERYPDQAPRYDDIKL